MKKITGLVVILAALILGAYYGTGLITEQTIKKNINVVNHSSGMLVNITDYHRHWFDSKAHVDVRMHMAERISQEKDGKSITVPAQDYTLDVPVTIYHGPVIYTGSRVLFGLGYAEGQVNFPKELLEQFATTFESQSKQPDLNLSVFVNYKNHSRFEMRIPAFTLIAKGAKGEINWLGMKGDVSASSDLNKIDGGFTLDGVKVVKDNTFALLGPVTSDYVFNKSVEGLYLGQAGVIAPSLVITQDGKPLFQLTNFKARSESMTKDSLFQSNFKASLDTLFVNGKSYGAGLIDVCIKNLDANVLATLNGQANKLKNTSGPERQKIMFEMLPGLPKLFGKGVSLELSTFKLTAPEGEVNGHFTLALPKGDVVNPFQLIQKIEGEGKIQLPMAIVKRTLVESIMEKETALTSPQGAIMASSVSQQPNAKPALPKVDSDKAIAPTSTGVASTNTNSVAIQQATDVADKKLAVLVQAKLLVQQGQDYVIEFQLVNGDLKINGQPFDPAKFKL